jgi:hypothetical protein
MYIDGATGNVGIGTTNPATNLMVYDTVSEDPAAPGSATTGMFALNSSGQATLSIGKNSGNTFWISNVNRAFAGPYYYDIALNPLGGDVGIGTTSPSERLDVDGKIRARSWFTGADNTNTLYSSTSTGVYLQGSSFTGAGSVISFRRTDGSIKAVVNTETGNVGIGTTNPGYKLDVNGVINVSDNNPIRSGDEIMIRRTDSTNLLRIGSGDASDETQFYAGGAERVRITSTGNVGIGTTSPGAKLDVNSGISSSSTDVIKLSQATTGAVKAAASLGISIQNSGEATNAADLWFTTASGGYTTERMRITSGGNVGIGTTNPSSKLEIRATDATHKLISINRPNSDTAALYIGNDSASPSNGIISSNNSDLIFGRDQSSTLTEHMRIKTDGNVGIGTTNPATWKLSVDSSNAYAASFDTSNNVGVVINGNNTTASQIIGYSNSASTYNELHLRTNSTTSDGLYIDSSGNVGIGTTSPDHKLRVNGDARIGNLHIKTADFGTQGTGKTIYADAAGGGVLGFTSTTAFDFSNGITSRMHITSAGNVGIGTTNPGAKLHTVKTSSGEGLRVDGAGSGFALIVNGGSSYQTMMKNTSIGNTYASSAAPTNGLIVEGNVGIGTTSPDFKLDVAGDMGIDGYIYHNGDDSRIGFEGNDAIRMYTANSVRLQINSNGNVGIGTTNPGDKLTVNGNLLLNIAGEGWIKGYDDWHSIKFRASGANATNYYEYGGTLAAGLGHKFFTGGTTGQTLKLQIADDGSYFSGNVGIGTTNPTFKLDVSGTVRASTYLVTPLIYSGGGNVVFGNVAQFNDFVGIGTTSPENKLHVQQSALYNGTHTTPGIRIKSDGASAIGNYHGTIALSRGTGSVAISAVQEATDSDVMGLAFFTHPSSTGSDAAVEKMRIDHDGNVGIGTTSPGDKLDISSTTGPQIRLTRNAGTEYSTLYSDSAGGLVISSYSGGSSNYQVFRINSSEKLRIINNGNVGIGTTSPAAGLQVAKGGTTIPSAGSSTASAVFGNSTSDDNYGVAIGANSSGIGYISSQRTDGNATTYNLAIQPNGGNVGIGTTSPGKKLEVVSDTTYDGIQIKGSSIPTLGIIDTTNNAKFVAYVRDSDATIGMETNHPLTINTNNTERMRITSAGNVGIGTTSPQQELHVVGYTRTTTLEANGLTGSINLGYGANFKGGLFNDQYLTGNPANSIDDLVTYAPYRYHITVGSDVENKVITVDSSNNVDIHGNIYVEGSTRLDSGGGQQPGILPNQTPADAIVRIGGAPEIYLSEPDEWLTINIGGTDYVIPAYLP